MTPESAIIAPVPEAEPFVGALRDSHDPSSRLGVPAHVTVLYPFVAPDRITESVLERLRQLAAAHSAFRFSLRSTGRFRDTLYLGPDPARPFVDLTEHLVGQFPACRPYRGQFDAVVPHLTVARGEGLPLPEMETELSSRIPGTGIAACCELLVLIENASGRWRERDRFPLATGVR